MPFEKLRQNFAAASDDTDIQMEMVADLVVTMLRDTDAAAELIDYVATADDFEELMLRVLASLLDEARAAAENAKPHGAACLRAIEARLQHLASSDRLGLPGRMALAASFRHAGLPTPEVLLLDGAQLPEKVDDLIEELLADAKGSADQTYLTLADSLAVLPMPMASEIVRQITGRSEARTTELGLRWVLDPDQRLRMAAVAGFAERSAAGSLDAAALASLSGAAAWLPDGPDRTALLALVKNAARRDVAGGEVPVAWQRTAALGGLPDGVGAQSFCVTLHRGRRHAVACFLIKQGHGLKDAYILPCETLADRQRILDDFENEMDAFDLDADLFDDLLARAIGEGRAAGLAPPPGFVTVAQACGFEALAPKSAGLADLLADLDRDGTLSALSPNELEAQLAEAVAWEDEFPVVESWFEDSDDRDGALPDAEELLARIEARRGWWALLFARTAVVLRAADAPEWLSFAATAWALHQGAAFADMVAAEMIMERTFFALEGLSENQEEIEPEVDGELARLLEPTGVPEAWVAGVLAALVLAPGEVDEVAWESVLLPRVAPLDEEALERVFDILHARRGAAELVLARLSADVAHWDRDALAEWARGLLGVARRDKRGWNSRDQSPKDREVLRALQRFTDGKGKEAAMRALLSVWLNEIRLEMR